MAAYWIPFVVIGGLLLLGLVLGLGLVLLTVMRERRDHGATRADAGGTTDEDRAA
jgi:hypothetical protein